MIFVTVVLPIQGKEADIEKIPNLVPVMAFCSVALPLFLMIAIWPIWGFWSPIYLFIMSLGYLFIMTFLPDGNLGTLVFWIITAAIATTSHLIPHPGHEHSW